MSFYKLHSLSLFLSIKEPSHFVPFQDQRSMDFDNPGNRKGFWLKHLNESTSGSLQHKDPKV